VLLVQRFGIAGFRRAGGDRRLLHRRDRDAYAGGIHEAAWIAQAVSSGTTETAALRYLQWALARHGGDRKSLAAQLGISERTLYRKLAG